MSDRAMDSAAQPDPEKAALARKQRMRAFLQIVGMLPILILLGIFFEISTDRFMSWMNTRSPRASERGGTLRGCFPCGM